MTILFLQTHNICVDCVECYGGRGELRCRSIVRVFTIITFNCHRLRHREEVSRGESHRCHAVQLQWLCPAASSPRCKVGHHTCNLYGVLSEHGAGSEGSLKPAKIKTTRESVRVWDNEEIKTRRGIKNLKKRTSNFLTVKFVYTIRTIMWKVVVWRKILASKQPTSQTHPSVISFIPPIA